MAIITNKIVDVANLIFDLSVTSDSIGYIANWIRDSGIGQLNNLIQVNFAVDDSLNYELNSNLANQEITILHKLYELFSINKTIQNNSGSSAFSQVDTVTSDGATVKMVNRNMISSNLLQLRKQIMDELKNLVTSYNNNNVTPLQTVGDDTFSADYYNNQFNSDLIHRTRR